MKKEIKQIYSDMFCSLTLEFLHYDSRKAKAIKMTAEKLSLSADQVEVVVNMKRIAG